MTGGAAKRRQAYKVFPKDSLYYIKKKLVAVSNAKGPRRFIMAYVRLLPSTPNFLEDDPDPTEPCLGVLCLNEGNVRQAELLVYLTKYPADSKEFNALGMHSFTPEAFRRRGLNKMLRQIAVLMTPAFQRSHNCTILHIGSDASNPISVHTMTTHLGCDQVGTDQFRLDTTRVFEHCNLHRSGGMVTLAPADIDNVNACIGNIFGTNHLRIEAEADTSQRVPIIRRQMRDVFDQYRAAHRETHGADAHAIAMSNAIFVRTTTALLQPGCDFRVAGDATRMQAFVRDALGISHHTDDAEEYAELLNGGVVLVSW